MRALLLSLLAVAVLVTACVLFRDCGQHRMGDSPTMYGEPRSGKWPKVRREHLEREPACAVCGATDGVEVHHCRPFNRFPESECDPDNLLTLCRVHHLWVGHSGSYRHWNDKAREDAKHWKARIEARKAN